MKYGRFIGLLIASVAIFMLISPVAACQAAVTKVGPEVACPTCEYYEYTITAQSSEAVALLRVEDTLPAGLTFISSSPVAPSTIVGQKLTWDFTNPGTSLKTIIVRVKPSSTLTSVSNIVYGKVMQYGSGSFSGAADTSRKPVVTRFSDTVCPHDAPEFPSAMLPVTMIIGFLGVVLFIQRTKE